MCFKLITIRVESDRLDWDQLALNADPDPDSDPSPAERCGSALAKRMILIGYHCCRSVNISFRSGSGTVWVSSTYSCF